MLPETTKENAETMSADVTDTTSSATKKSPKLRSSLRDGYEVHVAALRHGLNVKLLPRQVMEVSHPDETANTVGFVHGVPQSTTLAGATYAQDLRMRRAMLIKAGYKVPRGATFSVGRSRGLGQKFAERIGYPVVVKPAVGENTIEVQAGLENKRQLKKAIEYLFTPPSERKDFTRSAYALTELREPGKINGKIVAPPGYRFLVEKHVHGQYLRFLIINGEIRSIIYTPNGPWDTKGSDMRNVIEETHSSLKEIALGASRTIQGLSVVALDMVVPDYQAQTAVKNANIVEYSERPWLSLQYRFNPELASKLAEDILAASVPNATESVSKDLVEAEVLIGGAVDPVRLLEVLNEKFDELGVEGQLEESDHTLGRISGTVRGAASDIAWIMERLLDKGIQKQRAMLVELTELSEN